MMIRQFTRSMAVLTLMTSLIFLVPNSVRADETADLKKKIEHLENRIAELEKQAQEREDVKRYPTKIPASALANDPDPWSEMESMRRAMEQLFNHSYTQSFGPGQAALFDPKTDMKQTPTQYILSLDLPGMEKDSINIEAKDGMLTVSGERSDRSETKSNQFYRQERSFGSFVRSLPLPHDARVDDITANYQNGVLEIKIGRVQADKQEKSGSKKIKIN